MYATRNINVDFGGNLVSAAASGLCVGFPPGIYVFTGSEVFATNTKFVGAGSDLTVFSIDTAASIRVAGANATTYIAQNAFQDCSFVSGVTTTNPMFWIENVKEIRMQNVKVYCPNRWFANFDNVIGGDFINLYITQATNGILIGNQAVCTRLNFDGFAIREVSNVGIQIMNASAITFESPKITLSNTPFILLPNAAGRIVTGIYISNFSFATVSLYGFYLNATSGGVMHNIRIENGTAAGTSSGASYGAWLDSDTTSGTILDDVTISKIFAYYFGREGIYLGRSSNVRMIENTINSNSKSASGSYPGLSITANASFASVRGGRYGDIAGATPSQSYGIINNSPTARIANVQARNNVTGRVLDNTRSLL